MIGRRRAADELERALSTEPAGAHTVTVGTRRLVAVAAGVRDLAPAGPAPTLEFREALRLRVMAEAEGLSAVRAAQAAARRRRDPARDPGRPGRGRRVAALTLATTLVGGTAAAVASDGALPGQPLYPVKRSIEHLRLAATTSDAGLGRTQLALALERLDEAERMAASQAGGPPSARPAALPAETTDRIAAGLRDFGASAGNGADLLMRDYADRGDASGLVTVEDFLLEAVPRLERLRAAVPAGLLPEVDDLVDDLAETADRLGRVLASCGSACSNLGVGHLAPDPTEHTDGTSANGTAPGVAPTATGAVDGQTPVAGPGGTTATAGAPAGTGLAATGTAGVAPGPTAPQPVVGATVQPGLGLPGVGVEVGGTPDDSPTTAAPALVCLELFAQYCLG